MKGSRELIGMEQVLFDKRTLWIMGLASVLSFGSGCTAAGVTPPTTPAIAAPASAYSPIGLLKRHAPPHRR